LDRLKTANELAVRAEKTGTKDAGFDLEFRRAETASSGWLRQVLGCSIVAGRVGFEVDDGGLRLGF